MRRGPALLLVLLLGLAACHREPSFDERFDNAQARIRDTSASIDAQLANDQLANDQAPSPEQPARRR